MRIQIALPGLALTLLCASHASAQTRPSPDPGVTPVRQIDRAEVRVTRVELQPGAVRSVHQHDDVRFHLFIPVTGKLELCKASRGNARPSLFHGEEHAPRVQERRINTRRGNGGLREGQRRNRRTSSRPAHRWRGRANPRADPRRNSSGWRGSR